MNFVRRTRPQFGARALLRLSGICALSVAPVNAAAAGTLGQGVDDDVSAWRVVAALVLCLILAVAGAFVLRMRKGGGPLLAFLPTAGRRLHLTERLPLGRHVELCIVKCDGRELLVATSVHGAQLLDSSSSAPLKTGADS